MEIEFDSSKDASNLRDHGVSLAVGEIVLANAIGHIEDGRQDYGEIRMKAFGQVNDHWFVCVYTKRGDMTRILSVHPVREREVLRWLARKRSG